MRDKRFIIIKINSPTIAYGVIDGRFISFYSTNGKMMRRIDLSMMLEEIIDIPIYFKLLFEKGMDAVGFVDESETMEVRDFYQYQNPFMQLPPGIRRTACPELLYTFDLDESGTIMTIQISPQVDANYYEITITNYHRLIMDIIVNPVDMLYVDAVNGYMHTMECGHETVEFDPMLVMEFLHPELACEEELEIPKNVIYVKS